MEKKEALPSVGFARLPQIIGDLDAKPNLVATGIGRERRAEGVVVASRRTARQLSRVAARGANIGRRRPARTECSRFGFRLEVGGGE